MNKRLYAIVDKNYDQSSPFGGWGESRTIEARLMTKEEAVEQAEINARNFPNSTFLLLAPTAEFTANIPVDRKEVEE